ncbi:LysR family transcriptional regulator [Bradyrhizobium sp.]|uniref:LysR family transcriptional regulator n=1 Tax=Bradyrhizobium sp. TaxID=376 RepID=UPI001EB38549|nr:LysR family transcriptional regulator [Bradyrhizobium sp.]MBV8923374.1 LysR family transcriptional regulator [Bradyrhizobium sp.]MBV9980047.1 LysR family transcriptional regulator [Bradyrhizobium sp.]
MPLPDLNALEIAATVIEEGSMSAAAAQLGMTQSAVSQAMKRAEAQLDVTLVHRERRPLVPTEAGRVLVAHIREIGLRAERAIEEIRATALRPERQDLRLGMVDTFASAVGPALIRDLLEGSIALRVTAFSGLVHAHTDALMRHEIDAAISSDLLEGVDGLMRFPLFREPFLLVCPVAWSDTLRNRPLREVLFEHRLIRYSARSHTGAQIERHLRRLRIEHPQVLAFDTSDSLLAMVAGGVGVAISTPLCLLQGAIHFPGLAVLPLPSPGFSRELTLITRRGEFDTLGPRIAKAAREMLRRYTLPQIIGQIPWLAEMSSGMVWAPTSPEDVQAD